MKSKLLAAVGVAATLFAADAGTGYRDGDVVVFFGDSITHGGRYHAYIADFYRTRFPEADIRFVNSGIGGDSASGAMRRIPEDVAEYRPTRVTFHFGMNDIDRGSYLPTSTSESLMRRERAQADYRRNLDRLIGMVREAAPQAKFTYLTPTHYDDTAVITNAPPNWSGWASINNVGCNAGLSLMAGYVLTAAKRDGVESVDWYSLMNNFLMKRRATDPHFMTTAIDRVHPGPLGHSLMAWEFLKRQGVDPVVSDVRIDAEAGKVVSVTNATADGVVRRDGGVAFDLLAKALPFPVAPEALAYVGEYGVEESLNLEVVAVTGLAPGRYALRIDGETVGEYSDAEFAKGVRLGFNPKTPQYRQAQAVRARDEELRVREATLRNHHSARWFYGNFFKAPVDDVKAFAEWFEKNEKDKNAYFAKFVPGYLEYWPKYREVRAQLLSDQRAVRELARPKTRRYEVVPTERRSDAGIASRSGSSGSSTEKPPSAGEQGQNLDQQ